MPRILDSPLGKIRRLLREMHRCVEDLVINALITIKDPACGIGKDAEAQDEVVNQLEEEIGALITEAGVLHGPMANDYRFLMAARIIIIDLEHMGDSAKRICHHMSQLGNGQGDILAPLYHLVQRRITECFRALHQMELSDIRLADNILSGRFEIEDTFDLVVNALELEGLRQLSPREFEALLFATIELRRISEYAASIADQLVFYNTGTRHRFPRP
jgi:phosphate transport system protein